MFDSKYESIQTTIVTKLTSGCNRETGLLNSAKNGTLQNSFINASTFSYCTSVMGGTASSTVGTPGVRFVKEFVVVLGDGSRLVFDAGDFFLLLLPADEGLSGMEANESIFLAVVCLRFLEALEGLDSLEVCDS